MFTARPLSDTCTDLGWDFMTCAESKDPSLITAVIEKAKEFSSMVDATKEVAHDNWTAISPSNALPSYALRKLISGEGPAVTEILDDTSAALNATLTDIADKQAKRGLSPDDLTGLQVFFGRLAVKLQNRAL